MGTYRFKHSYSIIVSIEYDTNITRNIHTPKPILRALQFMNMELRIILVRHKQHQSFLKLLVNFYGQFFILFLEC